MDDILDNDLEKIIVTTAPTVANKEIDHEIEIITAECVFGRSAASQKILRDSRQTCLRELKIEAFELGADAVIGVDLDYQEFSGKGKGMLFLVASGTAVKLKD